MAEKNQPTTIIKSSTNDEESLKRKKRTKLAIYIAIFVVFQIIVITVFGLVVMRAKSPKLRLSNDFEFDNLQTTSTNPASFDMSFDTKVTVKNPNWGPYKFQNTTVVFEYDNSVVGRVDIAKGKAGMKSTKKIDVTVRLSSGQLANAAKLGSDLNAGVLTLSSSARMTGKVELMLIMKKNKSANMNCTITIDVTSRTLRSLQCK